MPTDKMRTMFTAAKLLCRVIMIIIFNKKNRETKTQRKIYSLAVVPIFFNNGNT